MTYDAPISIFESIFKKPAKNMNKLNNMKTPLLILVAFLMSASITMAQNWLWNEAPGGTAYPQIIAMCTDANGNTYATGAFSGTVTFGSLPPITATGSGNIFVVKFDNTGKPLWVSQTTGASYDQGYAIAVDASDNVYITGYFESSTITFDTISLNCAGTMDIFVAKYNSGGKVLWANRYGDASSSYEMGNAIVADPMGNVYVTGYFHGNFIVPPLPPPSATGASSEFDMFLMKLNTNGQGIWAKRTGRASGNTGNEYTEGTSIALNNMGILCVGAEFVGDTCFYENDTLRNNTVPGGASDALLAEYDTSGKFINKAAHISSYSYDQVTGLSADKSGNFYATGNYGGIMYFPNFTITSAGTDGTYNIWLLKMNAGGTLVWGNHIGNSTYGHYSLGLIVDTNTANANFYTWGYFQGECDFDTIVLPLMGGAYGMYLAEYDSAGAAQSVLISSRDAQSQRSVVAASIDGNDNLYVTGAFSDTLVFGSLPYLSTPGPLANSQFLAKYGKIITGISNIANSTEDVKVFPNPTSGIVNFQVNTLYAKIRIDIYNILGEEIYNHPFANSSASSARPAINISNQPTGVYMYRVLTENGNLISQGKFVIQK